MKIPCFLRDMKIPKNQRVRVVVYLCLSKNLNSLNFPSLTLKELIEVEDLLIKTKFLKVVKKLLKT